MGGMSAANQAVECGGKTVLLDKSSLIRTRFIMRQRKTRKKTQKEVHSLHTQVVRHMTSQAVKQAAIANAQKMKLPVGEIEVANDALSVAMRSVDNVKEASCAPQGH